jgi:hypothetical protein
MLFQEGLDKPWVVVLIEADELNVRAILILVRELL